MSINVGFGPLGQTQATPAVPATYTLSFDPNTPRPMLSPGEISNQLGKYARLLPNSPQGYAHAVRVAQGNLATYQRQLSRSQPGFFSQLFNLPVAPPPTAEMLVDLNRSLGGVNYIAEQYAANFMLRQVNSNHF